MIEPEYAERLGVCLDISLRQKDLIPASMERLRGLGIRHVRLNFDDGPIDDARLDWSLRMLRADVLPSFSATSAARLQNLLDRHGHRFEAVELCPDQTGSDVEWLGSAVRLVRDAGKQVVIFLPAACDDAQVSLLGDAGALQAATAISVAMTGVSEHTPPDRLLASARRYNPDLAFWITQAGGRTSCHDVSGQAELFVESLATNADRIYWCALWDTHMAGVRQQPTGSECGLYDEFAQPKLLARLLASGVANVQRVVDLARRAPATIGRRPVLVTGGAGFIGANLADRLAAEGHHVLVYDALARPGVERNLRWLSERHSARVSFTLGDLRDEPALEEAASNVSAVFHLAGQVAVTTSMVDPLQDFEVNARGTLALLEAMRRRNRTAPLIFASTNKVYGDLADIDLVCEDDRYLPTRADIRAHGVSEARPLCFHTPYGCSKGTADQYVLDYARSFGLRTAVLRMSCIYGERQFGTEDQGWVAHFLLRAIAGEKITLYGDGRQVRDVLHVGDAVGAYLAAWRSIDSIAGRAYNLGGGPANAISLLQLIEQIEFLLGRQIDVEFSAWRPGDQRYFVADTTAIRRDLQLPPALDWRVGLARLAEHFGATLATTSPVAEPAL